MNFKACMISCAPLYALMAASLPRAAGAELVVYPEYPEQIQRDYAYDVRVVQGAERSPLPVYNHCEASILRDRTHGGDVNRRFCEFAFSGAPVRVDVRVAEDVTRYKVFPARHHLRTEFREGVISVWLDRPRYFGLQLNDSDKSILSVFADAPENPVSVPAKDKPGVLYVDGWMDAPGPDGVIETKDDVQEVYLAPGSVLNARLRICGKGTRVHGRGMILDPLSDVFRFDQTKNTKRGVVTVGAPDVVLDGFKVVDARTFNFCTWFPNVTFRNLKAMASMMCTDGFTVGNRNFKAENCWLYVGDNALVVSGVTDARFKDIVLGTSCAAIFPQGNNKGAVLENIDVFRADDGLINNWYNAVLRRNNKWSEMNGDLQKKEPGPQDLKHLSHEFFFRNLVAVDCTLFSHFFSGRNMGTLPKTFAFDGLSIPGSTGRSTWRAAGKTDGVAIDTRNDPTKWLVTSNYTLTVTNLWLNGARADAFPATAFNEPSNVAVQVVNTRGAVTVPTVPDIHEVNWTCPYKVFVGGALQRDWRLVDIVAGERRLTVPEPGANIVAEPFRVKGMWQRVPSWLVKLEATGRDGGVPVYRLVQCEKKAGMQAVVTDAFLRRGNGVWRLAFDIKAHSDNPFGLDIQVLSNEKQFVKKHPVERDAGWKHAEVDFETDFDLAVTDLVAVQMTATATADEICFKNLSFRKVR